MLTEVWRTADWGLIATVKVKSFNSDVSYLTQVNQSVGYVQSALELVNHEQHKYKPQSWEISGSWIFYRLHPWLTNSIKDYFDTGLQNYIYVTQGREVFRDTGVKGINSMRLWWIQSLVGLSSSLLRSARTTEAAAATHAGCQSCCCAGGSSMRRIDLLIVKSYGTLSGQPCLVSRRRYTLQISWCLPNAAMANPLTLFS